MNGYIPNRYFYLSLIYKDQKLLLFNHLEGIILKEWVNIENINKYLFIKKNIGYLLWYIDNLKLTPNNKFFIFVPEFKDEKDKFKVGKEEISNEKEIGNFGDVNFSNEYYYRYNNYYIDKIFFNKNVEVLPFKGRSSQIPPVINYILKNWYKSNLNMLILKRLIKREKDLDKKIKFISYKNEILSSKPFYY